MKITPNSVQLLRSYLKCLVKEKNIGDSEYYQIGVRIALRVKNAKRKAKLRHGKHITRADLTGDEIQLGGKIPSRAAKLR